MDQATLTSEYPIIQTPDDFHAPTESERRRPPLLRRVSQSDPHLDVPHFLSVQDRGFHHGFHTTLSSLFENPNTFNGKHQQQLGENTENMNTSNTERKLSIGGSSNKPGIDRNKSAFELSTRNQSNDHLTAEPASSLRKVASVANYADHHQQPHNESLPHTASSSSFLSSAFHFVTGAGPTGGHPHHQNSPPSIQTIPEDDGGLTMSVRSASSFAPIVSSAAATGGLHTSSSADSAIAHGGSHLTSSGLADIGSLAETKNKTKAGMFSFLNRGFFAKPVLNDMEENYRYIIATDKF